MASQMTPIATTESTCSLETECGAHKFIIRGYSRHRGLGFGRYIHSARFAVGGHEWRIRYYPDGYGDNTSQQDQDYVGVQLELMSQLTKVRLEYDFRLAEDSAATPMVATSIFCSPSSVVLTSESSPSTCGTDRFMKKSQLEESRFLWDDCVVIHCIVTVIKESQLRETTCYRAHVQVPASNLSYDLGQLLCMGKDADMSFKVKTEVFRAHKIIIGMRCPVLKAQLDGQTRDRRTPDSSTIIEAMEPSVFRALLHFIYTDSLLDEHINEKMVEDLFEAADRYAMERMKLYCGSILYKGLTVQSVTKTIALAHKHRCMELKDACVQFIISSKRRMAEVFSSRGYEELEHTCPEVVVEILRKSEMFKVVATSQVFEERPAYHHGEGKS